ncbi:MAG: helix-turn-helix domain-containing protein [Gemmatimonadaceae bacterium]
MQHPTDFGRYLRAKRVEAKLSVRRLAGLLEISHVYLGEVERGDRGPLDEKYWPKLMRHVPGLSREGLIRAAATSRPIQLDISDSSAPYQDLAVALARRIDREDLDAEDVKKILRLLKDRAT